MAAREAKGLPPRVSVTCSGCDQTAVIEMDRGYHLVKLVKREYAGQAPFDEKVQKQIRDKLKNQTAQREMKRFVERLKRDAIIVYSKEMGN